jgi:hypothetical protein
MYEKHSYQSYYLEADQRAQAILDSERPEYLLDVDYQEYLQHLISRLSLETLEWDESAKSIEPFIGKRKVLDYGGYREVEQPLFRLRIPVSNHPALSAYIQFQPSAQHSGGEPHWNFQDGILIIETDADENAVENALKEVRFWLGGRNRDIVQGNANLPARLDAVWKRKRTELEAHMGKLKRVVETLKIPLHQSPTAPKPFSIRPKAERKRPSIALSKRREPELVRKDVLEVVDFVESYSRQLEVTPVVYKKLDEEELRDLVLGMLNVNYPGSTGESFSKLGKTDMLLRIEGDGSLIVECKRWHGQKSYGDSVGQLFGYLTWRHSYGILLTFCMTRDMTVTVDNAISSMSGQASLASGGVTRHSETRFSSIHVHPQDREKTVEVFHLFADLSI